MSTHQAIAFHYTLTDTDGNVIDSSKERGPLSFISGMGMIVPGLERELVGYSAGQKGLVEVKAEDGYGLIDFNLFVKVPREALPKPDLKVGDVFHSPQAPMPFRVKAIETDHVLLDGNHPLAGEDLHFDVEVVLVRDASEQEVEQLKEMIASAQQEMAAAKAKQDEAALQKNAEEGGEKAAE